MNRRGFVGALTGIAAGVGLTRVIRPAKLPAQEFVLVKRHIGPFGVSDDRYSNILIDDGSGHVHEFTVPLGTYSAVDLESPKAGDPSKLRAVGITPTGERVVFTPKPGY